MAKKEPEALGVDVLDIVRRHPAKQKETHEAFENKRLKELEADERRRGMRPIRAGTRRLTRAMDTLVKK